MLLMYEAAERETARNEGHLLPTPSPQKKLQMVVVFFFFFFDFDFESIKAQSGWFSSM